MFSINNEFRLEMNNIKMTGKFQNTWKLQQIPK